ncbi:hypothetical protein MAPG_01703 [Magnaporthiopsis poae ATCC 64411]|uniref:Mitochondrial outer membrane transport complex Sam37/metaxin N-terminal domain-containing protein n=1 Tax=Magnaporthiopsis poae (strain ATCC 64411 / 73-15) TaxID=644358 RepID=A0A0C4DPD9_MAGP6|nr:hypothetical protein MAPG_01703 [Magnaporthiopsis poae ATCC 64411]
MPILRLHVWGPAFGLASIDAECLAAIAYLKYVAGPGDYELVATSPSAVPTNHLPAVHNTLSGEWASGFQGVLGLIHAATTTTETGGRGPRAGHRWPSLDSRLNLPPAAVADSTAHCVFLTAHAAPLLALSLYVSSANWSGATRPAISQVLPFPLGWSEGPARRRAMSRRAEHLDFSDLDTDRDAADPDAIPRDAAARSFIPASLQPSRSRGGVSSSMTPEAKARFRLEAAAASVLDVLSACLGTGADAAPGLGEGWLQGPWAHHQDQDEGCSGSGGGGRPPSSFECLAFGYLALMAVPTLPRPWLREIVGQKHADLAAFVDDARAAWFSVEPSQLPWASDEPASFYSFSSSSPKSLLGVAARLVAGCMASLPSGMGTQWSAWRRERQHLEAHEGSGRKKDLVAHGGDRSLAPPLRGRSEFVTTAYTSLLGVSMATVATLVYRSLQPFGAPTHRFDGGGVVP